MSMSTPINQIRSRMTTGAPAMSAGAPAMSAGTPAMSAGATSMIYDPTPPPPIRDPSQLGTTFPAPPQMPSGNGDSNGMLEDILREMERSGAPDALGPDPNVGLMNYAINPVNIPPPMSQQARMQLQAEATHATAPMMQLDDPAHDSNANSIGQNSSTLLGELTGSALGHKIINTIKPLIFVFIIVLILSLHQTNRFIFSFFPQLLLENGQLSIYAILLRCTIAVILFYIANLVI